MCRQSKFLRYIFTLSVYEWYKHTSLLNLIIPALWERQSHVVNKRAFTPNNVVHITGNIEPAEIKLHHANESKIKYIASGSKPLKSPRKLYLCKQMEQTVKQLRTYLPVLIGMGVQCILPEILDEEIQNYEGLLKFEEDEREGRVLEAR